jgi:hypothetical protein
MGFRSRLQFLAPFLIAALFAATLDRGDELSGRIRNTVTDPTGAVVPGVVFHGLLDMSL